MQSSRRKDIDLLKGLSILAVVFYHIGILESGYLGVDIFFVIAGFLTIPKIVEQIQNGQFKYIRFVWGRVLRLLPILLIATVLCLVVGAFYWLPDDYENLAQSVIASSGFANNILAAITTKNYWDSSNLFKPLMHTWYLGVLMQFYIVFPIVALILNKFSTLFKKSFAKTIRVGIIALAFVSLALFLLPNFSTGDKFYFLHFRLYEILFGGIVALYADKVNGLNKKTLNILSFVSLFTVFCLLIIGVFTFDFSKINVETVIIGAEQKSSNLILPNSILVLLSTLFTSLFLFTSKENLLLNRACILPFIGQRSFSIFIWHQVFLALYRYSLSSTISFAFILIFLIVVFAASELSYRLMEKKISVKWSPATIGLVILICIFSGFIYLNAGMVRDVPELGLTVEDASRSMHAEYCDRVYAYNKDFESTNKVKVLLIGNSFARDFGNVLLESEYMDTIELSYASAFKEELVNRVSHADKIFVFGSKNTLPSSFWANVKDENNVYGIGTKNFGHNNGQIYFNRFKSYYFEQTVPMDPGYKELNDMLKSQWGDQYIDMFAPVMQKGQVRVFSDSNMYISQDTRHLTKAGAQYYARQLGLEKILSN